MRGSPDSRRTEDLRGKRSGRDRPPGAPDSRLRGRENRPGGRRRALSLTAVLVGAQTALVLLASRAVAAPSPTPTPTSSTSSNDPCRYLIGPGVGGCAPNSGSNAPTSVTDTLDPLSSLARGCADAAAWVINELSKAVTKTATVDFTNAAFLRQYAVVFAASTVLTLVLWLLAVAKRAVRGIPLTEALTEAVGFLWLTVIASAFTPLILYTVVSATDAVTDVIAAGTSSNTDVFFGSFAGALSKNTKIGGGPVMLILVSLFSVLAAGVLWLELVLRAALLYVGALLGTVVYSGLVDKNMWGHVRGWAGVMIAVIMVKPVIVVVLGLAGALSSSAGGPAAFGAVVSGLAIILLAIFASFMIYRFVPGFGDDVQSLRNNRKASGQSQAAAVISSPAALVKQGIKTHSARGGPQEQASGGGQSGNPLAGGMAAHSSRGSNPGAGATTPPPRTQDRGNNSNNGTPGGDRR